MRLLVLVFSILYAVTASTEPVDYSLPDVHGKEHSLADYRGKWVVVNYWATWCIPCRVEFPSLVAAQEKLKDENYVFLFPTPDEAEMILDFQQKNNYPFQYLQMEVSLESMGISALPSTVIYSSDGKEHKRLFGAHQWDNEDIINLLKKVP